MKKQLTSFIKWTPPKSNINNKFFTFRPQTFSQYIGQERAKTILANYISAIKTKQLIFPHTLIHASAGMGKTTLANIISKELNVKLINCIANELETFEDIHPLILQTQNGILFLDEIHTLKKGTAEKLYSIMEDFKYNDIAIPYFTLIGATTEVGTILKSIKPLYDRFKLIIELEPYNINDLFTIAKQYKEIKYPEENIDNTHYDIIAINCRGNPRTVIRLLDTTVYFNGNIDKVLDVFGIIKEGFTIKDLKLLTFLHNNITSIGLQGIASFLDTSAENYLYEIEPFLLQKGLLTRTPRGRKITEEGIKFVKEFGGV